MRFWIYPFASHEETFCLDVLCIADIGRTAVSGYRAKKLSIRAVCNRFLVDRPYGSAKLHGYEIARSFAVDNWSYLMGQVLAGVLLTSQEDRFRIRSLMLYMAATEKSAAPVDGDDFFVASFNDAPFDEQVNSKCTQVTRGDAVFGVSLPLPASDRSCGDSRKMRATRQHHLKSRSPYSDSLLYD
jgi:hypothetical protein